MKYRVIQWATGGVGRAAIEGVVDHPDYVCRAAPGIKTYLDLPLVCGRAARSLRR